jgi:hypothetical protein
VVRASIVDRWVFLTNAPPDGHALTGLENSSENVSFDSHRDGRQGLTVGFKDRQGGQGPLRATHVTALTATIRRPRP